MMNNPLYHHPPTRPNKAGFGGKRCCMTTPMTPVQKQIVKKMREGAELTTLAKRKPYRVVVCNVGGSRIAFNTFSSLRDMGLIEYAEQQGFNHIAFYKLTEKGKTIEI